MEERKLSSVDLIDIKAVEWWEEAEKLRATDAEDSISRSRIEHRMESLRSQIAAELMLKVYPFFRRKMGVYAEAANDVFIELIYKSLLNIESKSAYDPRKGSSFYAYFKKMLELRKNDAYPKKRSSKEQSKPNEKEQSTWENYRKSRGNEAEKLTLELWGGGHSKENEIICKIDFLKNFRRLIMEMGKALNNEKKSRCLLTLFTFHTIKETEDEKSSADRFITRLYIAENVFVFPMMLIDFVVFLKDGVQEDYRDMHDIIEKDLKSGINLRQKQDLISSFLGATRQTIGKYERFYEDLAKKLWKQVMI